MLNLEFVTASHNEETLSNNLGASSVFWVLGYGLTVQEGYTNIAKAYNEAQTSADLVCYVHNDVFLPRNFIPELANQLHLIPKDWEVLGVAGVTGPPRQNYGYILDRGKSWGAMRKTPVKVDTLDELLLITRGNIKFDEQFSQDFYGADICIGRNAYVVPCFVHHNSSREFGGRTPAFYEAEKRFKIKHNARLPIQTTCTVVMPGIL